MKKREELDMTAIVDATINAIHESKGSPGGMLDPFQKNKMATALLPIIWHSTQAVLDQLAPADDEAAEEDAFSGFTVPDSLEGLEGFDGLASA